MAECICCGNEFSDKRKELGYRTCLKCGDILSKLETEYKFKRCAPAYNKGGYMYITDNCNLKSLGRKN